MAHALRSEPLRRPQAVWWAVLLALLLALAPTLTRALAFAGLTGAQRMVICTTQGPQSLAPAKAQTGDAPAGQGSTAATPHCPLCLHQADRLVPPPQPMHDPVLVAGLPQALPAGPVLFHSGTPALWAPPRGPPASIGS